ncbi:MAG: hypothetical protein LBS03_00860 [Bacteroidales bacterium]|jgi:hypothetical protein|nr:hypothetical protein [Bacteroidales bacterium]
MKIRSMLFLWMLACASAVFHSCKKDKDEEETITINAKWEITDAGSKYVSFEFNKDGNYIVVEESSAKSASALKDAAGVAGGTTGVPFIASPQRAAMKPSASNQPVTRFGSYTMRDEQTLVLSGFGVLRIIAMTEKELSFSLTLEGQTKAMQFNAVKAKNTVSASTQTDRLCRTWNLVTLIGLPIAADSESAITMLISRAGTYFCEYGYGASSLSQWKWYDYPGAEKETVIAYSHDNWNTMGVGIINTLTDDTLILTDAVGFVYEFALINDTE